MQLIIDLSGYRIFFVQFSYITSKLRNTDPIECIYATNNRYKFKSSFGNPILSDQFSSQENAQS